MTEAFDDDTVIRRIVRNPFDFGPTYIKLTYGKEKEDSYVLNEDSDNELKKYLKIFLVLATSVAEKKNTDDILNKNLYYLFDEKESLINIEEFSEFVKGLCNKVEKTIKEKPLEITDAVEEGDSCPNVVVDKENIKIDDTPYVNLDELRGKIKSMIATKQKCAEQVQKKINQSCGQEIYSSNPICSNPMPISVTAGGGRKIKTQKGNKSRNGIKPTNGNKSKNKISRKNRTKKNSQKGGASNPTKIKVVQRVEKRIEEVLPPGASVGKNSHTVDGVRLPLYCINIKDIPERNRRKAPESIYSNFMDLGRKYVLKNLCCVYRRNFDLTEWKFDEGEAGTCMNEARGKYGTCPEHTCFNCGFPKYRHSKYCDFCILRSSGGLKADNGLVSRIFKDRYPFCDTLRHTQEYYREIRNNLQYYIDTKRKQFSVSTSSLPAPPPKKTIQPSLPPPPGRGVSASVKTPGQGLFDDLNRMPIGEGTCGRDGRGGKCTYTKLNGYDYCNMHTCSLNLLGEGGNIGGELFRCSGEKASTDRYCAVHKEPQKRWNDLKHVQDVFSTFKHYEGIYLSEFLRSEATREEGSKKIVKNPLTFAEFKKQFPDNKYDGDVEKKATNLFEFCFPGAAVPTNESPEYEELPVTQGLPHPGELFDKQTKPGAEPINQAGDYSIAEYKEGQGPSRKAPPPPIRKVADNYFIINDKLCKYIPGEGVKHELNILKSLKNKLKFYTNTNNDKNLTEILLLPEIVEASDLDSTKNISKPDKAVIRSFMGDGIYTKLKYSENFLDKSKFISLDEIIQNRDDGILAKFFTDRFNAFTYISADPAFYLQFKYEEQPFQNIKLFIILLLVIMRKLYQVSLFVHGNLNASNIMISLTEPKFYIINFEYSAIIENTAESTAPPKGEKLNLGDVNLIHSHLTEYPGFKEIFDYLSAERENVGVSNLTDVDVKLKKTMGTKYLDPAPVLKDIAFKNYVIHLTDVYLILFGNQGRYQGDITIFNEILENIRCFLIRTITTAGGPFSKDPVFTREMMDTFMESHRVSEPYISQNVIYAAFLCFANRY